MNFCPHAPPLRGSLPPKGARFALGRPGGKTFAPTLRRCAGRCPLGGRVLPWGGPAALKGDDILAAGRPLLDVPGLGRVSCMRCVVLVTGIVAKKAAVNFLI